MKNTTHTAAANAAAKPAKALTAKQIANQAAKTAKFFAEQEAAKVASVPVLEVPQAATLPHNVFSNMVKQVEIAAVDVIADSTKIVKTHKVVIVYQNGAHRQKAGSVGDKLWTLYKNHPTKNPSKAEAEALASANGLNVTSAGIALYNYRKFHGFGTVAKAAKAVKQGEDAGLVALTK